MNKLFRYINQNRRVIRITLIFIIFIIIFIQVILDNIKKNQETNNYKNTSKDGSYNYGVSTSKNINSESNNSVISDKSIITGETVNSEKLSNDSEIIKNFLDCCKEEKISKAYDLLSDDCKNEMFPSINSFKFNYYDTIFGQGEKIYTIENWSGNTYKVNISDNILSTGDSQNDNNYQDYITIKDDKLNINNFIGKQEVNSQNENNGLIVKVINKLQYIDYTEYEIEFDNERNYSILIDDLSDVDSMYIVDENDVHYSAYTNEIPSYNLSLDAGNKVNMKIKYSCKYSSTRKIKEMDFTRISLNYEGNEEIDNYFDKIYVTIL